MENLAFKPLTAIVARMSEATSGADIIRSLFPHVAALMRATRCPVARHVAVAREALD
jgi:hypothetical protein